MLERLFRLWWRKRQEANKTTKQQQPYNQINASQIMKVNDSLIIWIMVSSRFVFIGGVTLSRTMECFEIGEWWWRSNLDVREWQQAGRGSREECFYKVYTEQTLRHFPKGLCWCGNALPVWYHIPSPHRLSRSFWWAAPWLGLAVGWCLDDYIQNSGPSIKERGRSVTGELSWPFTG